MGAVMQSIWINYSSLVCEDWLWTEENIARANENRSTCGLPLFKGFPLFKSREEMLSEKEAEGGEDKSFREHVKKHVEEWTAKKDDPYWNFDKRIGDWINKVFESRIPK